MPAPCETQALIFLSSHLVNFPLDSLQISGHYPGDVANQRERPSGHPLPSVKLPVGSPLRGGLHGLRLFQLQHQRLDLRDALLQGIGVLRAVLDALDLRDLGREIPSDFRYFSHD